MISQTWGYDEFFTKIINDSKVSGHQSLMLRAMGIPSAKLDAAEKEIFLNEHKKTKSEELTFDEIDEAS